MGLLDPPKVMKTPCGADSQSVRRDSSRRRAAHRQEASSTDSVFYLYRQLIAQKVQEQPDAVQAHVNAERHHLFGLL
jgi:hypothetical protein